MWTHEHSTVAQQDAAACGSKVYASASMAPQLYVSLSGQCIAPNRLLHGAAQQQYSPVGSGMTAGARCAYAGGPLAPMVPPDHLEPDTEPSGRSWRADVRPINYSPLNLERFAQAHARKAEQIMAETQEARNRPIAKRSKQ